jgi:hypothetical protein
VSEVQLPTEWSLAKVISLTIWTTQSSLNELLQSAPEIKQDYPLNLSISVSGGKETNKDCLSSGERSGKSSK